MASRSYLLSLVAGALCTSLLLPQTAFLEVPRQSLSDDAAFLSETATRNENPLSPATEGDEGS